MAASGRGWTVTLVTEVGPECGFGKESGWENDPAMACTAWWWGCSAFLPQWATPPRGEGFLRGRLPATSLNRGIRLYYHQSIGSHWPPWNHVRASSCTIFAFWKKCAALAHKPHPARVLMLQKLTVLLIRPGYIKVDPLPSANLAGRHITSEGLNLSEVNRANFYYILVLACIGFYALNNWPGMKIFA